MREILPQNPKGFISRRDPRNRGSLEFANAYLHGERSARDVAATLVKRGPFGKLVAGEIIVDEACKSTPSNVTSSMNAGKGFLYTAAQVARDPQYSGPSIGITYETEHAKAKMRMAQIIALEVIHGKQRLPSERTATTMYEELVRLAGRTVDVVREKGPSRTEDAIELRGVVGEMAVLLLAQRAAIKVIGCEEWLPLQSLYSEDHGGDCIALLTADSSPRWDMNVFTRSDSTKPPDRSYEVQIKSWPKEHETVPVIAPYTIYVATDLAVRPGEPKVSHHIIEECLYEQSPECPPWVLTNLEQRTEGLLNILN
jgi:hypothetical protein